MNYLNIISQLNNLLKHIQLLYNIIIFYTNINNLNQFTIVKPINY